MYGQAAAPLSSCSALPGWGCACSAYINTFLAAVCQADALAATAEIAPVVEEMMKLLPLVFYLLVFEPEGIKSSLPPSRLPSPSPPLKNVCYLIQNGADRFSFIFFRGFGTGAMHVLCGLIVGGGLAYAWRRTWLKVAGTCGLLGAAITLHAIYNLLIAYGGAAQYIAYALPVLLVAAGRWSAFRRLCISGKTMKIIPLHGELSAMTEAVLQAQRGILPCLRQALWGYTICRYHIKQRIRTE